jgi:DNA-binding Xre family transcriptional regulator
MPVMNKLRNVLKSHGIQNPNQLRARTGIGQQTALDAWNDPFWVPSAATLQTICQTFKIQPGDFLFYLHDDDDAEAECETVSR